MLFGGGGGHPPGQAKYFIRLIWAGVLDAERVIIQACLSDYSRQKLHPRLPRGKWSNDLLLS